MDVDDCVAVTPCGHLILSLNKETYQTIGLEGGVLQKNLKRLSSKYCECIILRSDLNLKSLFCILKSRIV